MSGRRLENRHPAEFVNTIFEEDTMAAITRLLLTARRVYNDDL
ncbi:MAG: hypothetical protein AAF423_13065 [Pseudomonadota bacterium]